jgi:hypothetical protein
MTTHPFPISTLSTRELGTADVWPAAWITRYWAP